MSYPDLEDVIVTRGGSLCTVVVVVVALVSLAFALRACVLS